MAETQELSDTGPDPEDRAALDLIRGHLHLAKLALVAYENRAHDVRHAGQGRQAELAFEQATIEIEMTLLTIDAAQAAFPWDAEREMEAE